MPQEIEQHYWMSFASREGFLGAAFVQAKSPIEAIRKAHQMGIAPGGEVRSVPTIQLPPELIVKYANRLLDKEEITRFEQALAVREIAPGEKAPGEQAYEFYRHKTRNLLLKWDSLSAKEHDWWHDLERKHQIVRAMVDRHRTSVVAFIRAKSNEFGEKAKDDPRLLMLQAMAAYGHDLACMIEREQDIADAPDVGRPR